MTGEPVRGPLAGHLLTPQDWALIVFDCQPPHLMKMALAGGGGWQSMTMSAQSCGVSR